MFATSGYEDDASSSSMAVASVPAALMALAVIVLHFALIYLFKKNFVPTFARVSFVTSVFLVVS